MTGATGPTGPMGSAGVFSGNFNGATTFSGPSDFNGTTRFNGKDLFTAAMTGTFPAIVGSRGLGEITCGAAPMTFNIANDLFDSAAYGHLVYTDQGGFNKDQSSASLGCTNICFGPVTYFLTNTGAARTITLNADLDDGPSYAYINGANPLLGGSRTLVPNSVNFTVNIPTGNFALSFVSCSNNGPPITFHINVRFITAANTLEMDLDRIYHRNGR